MRILVFLICGTFFSWRYLDFAEEVSKGYFHVTRFGLSLHGDDAMRLQVSVLVFATFLLFSSLRRLVAGPGEAKLAANKKPA